MTPKEPSSSVHGDSPGKNTGEDCHALLQGIFLNQGSSIVLNPLGELFVSWGTLCLGQSEILLEIGHLGAKLLILYGERSKAPGIDGSVWPHYCTVSSESTHSLWSPSGIYTARSCCGWTSPELLGPDSGPALIVQSGR